MNNVFYYYFGKESDLKKQNSTSHELIKDNEHKIISIYNNLKYKNQKIKKEHRYIKLLKYNMLSIKQIYRTIINQLKKITNTNNKLKLKNNQEEIKKRLVITKHTQHKIGRAHV